MATNRPFRAITPIDVAPFIRAYNVGDLVADDAVEANGWQTLVAREGTKAAEQAVTEAQAPEQS